MSRRGPFAALALAEVLSLSGTRLSTIALPWLVLATTGDPVLTGLAGLAELLPYVLAKGLGGPWIDRLGARRVALAGDAASVLVVGIVPLLHAAGLLSFWVLLPILVTMGVLRGPSDAAKQSLVPQVARLAAVPLERVTGVLSMIERLASVAGAAAAGGLIALIGPAPALLVNAATFALSALVVLLWLPHGESRPAPERHSYGADLREGWRFLAGDAVLLAVVGMVAVTNLLDQAYAGVLLVVWAQGMSDPALLGLLLAVFSGASIVGAGLAALTGERLPRLLVYTLAFLITGAPRFLVFAVDAPLALLFVTLAAGGFASGFLNPIISALMFERIPAALVGRVTALVGALCWALLPFGGLVGGLLVNAFGLAAAFAIAGIGYLLATLLPLVVPGFRGMGRPAAPAAPQSPVAG